MSSSIDVKKNETEISSNQLDSKIESANSVLSIRDNMNILIDEIEALSK